MIANRRFGRKIELPSTRQILHELRLLSEAEALSLSHEAVAVPSSDKIPVLVSSPLLKP
jgi:hypothetical protein